MSSVPTEDVITTCARVGELLGMLLALQLDSRPVLQNQPDELLTRKQAALRMKVSVSTFDGWRKQGVVKPVSGLGERTVRYRASDLDQLVARRRK